MSKCPCWKDSVLLISYLPIFSDENLLSHLQSDSRFVWNQYAMQPLLSKPELSRYWLPIILGCEYFRIMTVECLIHGLSNGLLFLLYRSYHYQEYNYQS